MEKFLQDLRFAIRVYAKNRSFTTYVVVYVAVILLLSLIAMIATLGPAMRATRVDLTTVLRQ